MTNPLPCNVSANLTQSVYKPSVQRSGSSLFAFGRQQSRMRHVHGQSSSGNVGASQVSNLNNYLSLVQSAHLVSM
jgi:hypothetical protein